MTADVVGTDHDDRRLGIEFVDLVPVGNAPEDVAGLIAADAEVDWLERAEMLLPGLLSFPAVGDGIAEEDDVASALACLDALEEILVPPDISVELLDCRIALVLLSRVHEGRQTES